MSEFNCEQIKDKLSIAKDAFGQFHGIEHSFDSRTSFLKDRKKIFQIRKNLLEVILDILEELAYEDFTRILMEGEPNFKAIDRAGPKSFDIYGIRNWVRKRAIYDYQKRKLIFLMDLNLTNSKITRLPKNFVVRGLLNLSKTSIKELPDELYVEGNLLVNESLLDGAMKMKKQGRVGGRVLTPVLDNSIE